MLLAKINYGNENTVILFDTWEQLNQAVFCPDYTVLDTLEFKISGKTYAEKKASLEDIAIRYSNLCGEWACSDGELFLVNDFFEKYGKRYGLLTDFRENGLYKGGGNMTRKKAEIIKYQIGDMIFNDIDDLLGYIENVCYYDFKRDFECDLRKDWTDSTEYEMYVHRCIWDWLFWELQDNSHVDFCGLPIDVVID